jgi:hypothetical protein
MKYKNRKGKNKKPKIWVSKKNAHITRSVLCKDEYGVKGICIGMLRKPHQIKLKLIKKTKNRKYLQIMVNLLKRGYGWWASTQMARYFTGKEIKTKMINPVFNSKNPKGRITTTKELEGQEARFVISSSPKVGKRRRIRASKKFIKNKR